MNKMNWGVLGVSGHFKQRILIPVRNSQTNRIYGLASRDGEKAARAAKSMGIPHSFGSYQELLNSPEIEGVYIPLPNTSHLEWIEKAAAAGKHVLCEKPLTTSLEDTTRAFETARKHKVFLMEAFMFQFHPQWVRVGELMEAGEIGKPMSVQIQFGYNNRDEGNIRNILALGGGALRDIGCYAIAVSQFIAPGLPKRVSSVIKRDPNFKTDFLTSGLMDYEDMQTTFSVSTQSFSGQNVKITGTGGIIEILVPFNTFPDVPARVRVTNGVGERIIETEPADQYACQFERYSRAVEEKDTEFFKDREKFSLEIQQVMDGLFLSEKTGTWVEL